MTCFEKNWVKIKHQPHHDLGTVFYIKLSMKQICEVENVLRVLHNPRIRAVWDKDLVTIHKLEGHDILDSKIFTQRKKTPYKELNRFVRFYQGQVVICLLYTSPSPRDS